METKHPSMLDLLLETHIGLERQGPGSSEVIEQALGFIKPLNKFSRIADLGCGTGGQTIHLAQHLPGTITGLDKFADFIEKLNENAKSMNLGNRVKPYGKQRSCPSTWFGKIHGGTEREIHLPKMWWNHFYSR